MDLALTTPGALPISVAEAKAYLKIDDATDDALLGVMLEAVTLAGEGYTGRDFRANTWTQLVDDFEDVIVLPKSPVASVTSVSHWSSGAWVAVDSTVYGLTKMAFESAIYLAEEKEWPDRSVLASDLIPHGIRIVFVTAATPHLARAKLGMYEHLAFAYANRGDCAVEDQLHQSGAAAMYAGFRVPRY